MRPLPISTLFPYTTLFRSSPVDLLDECLERIDRFESRVHAWVVIDRDGARKTAKERHDEVQRSQWRGPLHGIPLDRKSTRLNSSHLGISYAVFCLKKKKKK